MSGPAQQPGGAPSPAQWALARMLDAAFDDRETAARCMELALLNASRRTIPQSIDEMLAFGREHLLPIMADELGPRIVQALFEDLTGELARLRRSDVHSAMPRPMKSSVPRLTVPPVDGEGGEVVSEVPVSNPTIHSPAPSEDPAARPVIAIVEADRWTRASIARVLVQGGYDVLPLDGPSALGDLPYEIDIMVIDVGEAEIEAIRALREKRPNVRIVAWTKVEASEAGRRLRDAGIAHHAAIARAATSAQVADAVRSLA